MKRIAILCAAALFSGCAQSGYTAKNMAAPESLVFDSVFTAPGMPQDSIYEGVKIWIAENFKSSKAVIEYDNKAEGRLIGNGAAPYICAPPGVKASYSCSIKQAYWLVLFTMRVDVKEEKYRLSFTNLQLTGNGGGSMALTQQEDLDIARPVLMGYGDLIKQSFKSHESNSNW